MIVENLSSRTSWQVRAGFLMTAGDTHKSVFICLQDLKDFMRAAAEVTYSDVRDGEGYVSCAFFGEFFYYFMICVLQCC